MTGKRRFYTTATVTPDLGVALDGRPVKTPMKALLTLPNRPLAEAVAAEWQAQGERIDPATMVFTRLANTAIDRVAPDRARIEADVADYADSDLVCYRADRPPDLVQRHAKAWDPVVDWARTALDAPFEVRVGLVHGPQPLAARMAHAAVVKGLGHFELAVYYSIMTLTGSALLATMLARRAAAPGEVWAAAHVDEDYQIEQWGADAEAGARRAARRDEFMACCRFLELARG